MQSPVADYLAALQRELSTGHAQEHSYRPALKALFEAITQLTVVNEPKGSEHGRPDFIFLKGEVPLAYVEAKDITVSLDKVEKSEQMARYFGYANLVLTNGIEFRFFKNGARYNDAIVLATKSGQTLTAQESAFSIFADALRDFITEPSDAIRSAEHLAKIMGGKARRLRDNITEILDADFHGQRGDIESVLQALKAKLIHDITPAQFADLYAQTLVYGLFVARYNDDTPETFSRTEAREKIPAGNPLLRQFFDHIAGANFLKKLSFIVDELCEVFVCADVHALVHGLYLKKGDDHDPIIHFYEDFLKEYDPKLRSERGVFYTPLPVVRYIVRSVDHILKEHFALSEGLADRAQIEWPFTQQGKTSKRAISRVQVLDPATGTGTFLNEVIREVHTRFAGQEGMWDRYVHDHLLPRLHGFELMMASYTIAHLKLSMTLAESGVDKLHKRLRIFLTNSLEEAPEKDDTLFRGLGLDGALTEEALLAEEVKRDYPIMVVLGNPPYSVSSQNASVETGPDGKKRKTWIGTLIDDYKKDLNEKKLNLDDDYIKFLRFAHHLVDKNRQGVVAMITNNSFLDGITHRRMRQSLMESFDHIYVLDLHGNSKRKEKAPDGGKDENVFDIMQGVGITFLVKTGEKNARHPEPAERVTKKKPLAHVHHCELYGKREIKYDFLNAHDMENTEWQKLEAPSPNFFFVPKDLHLEFEYGKGYSIPQLFQEYNSGIQTKRDNVAIQFYQQEIVTVINDFRERSSQELKLKYLLPDDGRDWKIQWAKDDVQTDAPFISIQYRPFDERKTFFSGQSKGFIAYPRAKTTKHMLHRNFGLALMRSLVNTREFSTVSVTMNPIDINFYGFQTYLFPLYLYPDSPSIEGAERRVNLNRELVAGIEKKLGMKYEEGQHNVMVRQAHHDESRGVFGPEDIFDYIYAVLHSPTYRERYKEFLKIDFPRVPFTSDKNVFWKLVTLGREIRLLHLMESPKLHSLITQYPVVGSNEVEKVFADVSPLSGKENGRNGEGGRGGEEKLVRVWINATQFFDNVPQSAWEFFIGGYQPAQKWLKDRKGRTLSSDDLLHWQKIIVALTETKRLMGEVDAIGEFPMV